MELLPYRSLRDLVCEDGPLPPGAGGPGRPGRAGRPAGRARGRHPAPGREAGQHPDRPGRPGGADRLRHRPRRRQPDPYRQRRAARLAVLHRARAGQGAGKSARPGAPADLWGLGASLYTAVEGHPPFERGGALATLTAVVADEPEQPRHAGPLGPVIEGLLRKDPGQRLGAGEAERMLRLAAAAEPPEPEPAGAGAGAGAARPSLSPLRAESAAPGGLSARARAPEPIEPEPVSAGPQPGRVSGDGSGYQGRDDRGPGAAPPRPGAGRARRLLVLAAAGVTALAIDLTGSPSPTAASGRPPRGVQPGGTVCQPGGTVQPGGSVRPRRLLARPPALPRQRRGRPRPARRQAVRAGAIVPAGLLPLHQTPPASPSASPTAGLIHHVRPETSTWPIRPTPTSTCSSSSPASRSPTRWPTGSSRPPTGPGSYADYHLIRLAVGDLPAGREGGRLGVHLHRPGRAGAHPEPERAGGLHPRLRALLVHADSDWTADNHYFQVFAATFRPA